MCLLRARGLGTPIVARATSDKEFLKVLNQPLELRTRAVRRFYDVRTQARADELAIYCVRVVWRKSDIKDGLY